MSQITLVWFTFVHLSIQAVGGPAKVENPGAVDVG